MNNMNTMNNRQALQAIDNLDATINEPWLCIERTLQYIEDDSTDAEDIIVFLTSTSALYHIGTSK